MTKTRIFHTGNSRALRIPLETRTDTHEYRINRIGDIYAA